MKMGDSPLVKGTAGFSLRGMSLVPGTPRERHLPAPMAFAPLSRGILREAKMFTLILLALLLLPFLIIGGGLSLFWRRKRRAIWRWCRILYPVAALLLLFGVGPYLMAWAIVHANSRPPDLQLKDTPADFGISYEEIEFDATDSLQ